MAGVSIGKLRCHAGIEGNVIRALCIEIPIVIEDQF